jgi:hypothetical protein
MRNGALQGLRFELRSDEKALLRRSLDFPLVLNTIPTMRWLLIGSSMSPAVGEALKRFKHHVFGLADAELPADAGPEQILEAAAKKQWDILTTDSSLAEFPFEWNRRMTRCMVYLQLAGGEVEQDDAIDRLFARYKRLTPGRLYTVTETRVKVRQFPTNVHLLSKGND